MSFESVLCVFVCRWISTVCLSHSSGSGSKTRCSAHFLAQSWPKGGLFKASRAKPWIHQSSTTAVKSFGCHSVNIVCLWTTCQCIYKARWNKNEWMHCGTAIWRWFWFQTDPATLPNSSTLIPDMLWFPVEAAADENVDLMRLLCPCTT